MKEKKWIDCPSCGSKESMTLKKDITETYHNTNYEPITISNLEGYFCDVCNEGVYTIKSSKKIASCLAEEKARQDSNRIVASSILDVDSVAKKLSVTRQRVHQMMAEGKISYVYVGKNRFPIKGDEKSFRLLKKKIHGHSRG